MPFFLGKMLLVHNVLYNDDVSKCKCGSYLIDEIFMVNHYLNCYVHIAQSPSLF